MRGVFAPAKLAECLATVCRDRQRLKRIPDGSIAADPGRSVGNESRGTSPSRCVAPVGQLLLVDLAREPLALPLAEVGVLDRQIGQAGGPARGRGIVEFGQLLAEDVERPGVGDDVVHDNDDARVLRRSFGGP